MTFAKLLLEIRRRASALPDNGDFRVSYDQVVRESLALERDGSRRAVLVEILQGLTSGGEGQEIDPKALDEISPETILKLDMLIDALTGGGRTDDALRAIRLRLLSGL